MAFTIPLLDESMFTWQPLTSMMLRRVAPAFLASDVEEDDELVAMADEAWWWQNPVAMKAVQQGLRDSAEGRLVERGSFAPYADEGDA